MKYTLIHARSESGDNYYAVLPGRLTDEAADQHMHDLADEYGDTVYVEHIERGELEKPYVPADLGRG